MSTCGECKFCRDWGFLTGNYVCTEPSSEIRYEQVYTLGFDEKTNNEVFNFNESCNKFEQVNR